MATEMSNEQLVSAIVAKPVEDRRSIMAALMEALVLGGPVAMPAVGKGGRATAKDPSAPKREANWWIKATVNIRSMLKAHIEADNAARAEAGEAKIAGTAPTTIASMLREAGQLGKDREPTEEEVLAMYDQYKADPPAPKSGGSTASKGSSTGSAKTKFSTLSPEEQKAKRSEAAKKAAATRAANKAAKAAGDSGSVSGLVKEIDTIVSAAKQPAATAAAADEPEGEYYEWEHNFGKGNQMFVRKNVAGKAYIYIENAEGDLEYQGVFEAAKNKLNKAIADIQDTE
jgi:hypothetical protein